MHIFFARWQASATAGARQTGPVEQRQVGTCLARGMSGRELKAFQILLFS